MVVFEGHVDKDSIDEFVQKKIMLTIMIMERNHVHVNGIFQARAKEVEKGVVEIQIDYEPGRCKSKVEYKKIIEMVTDIMHSETSDIEIDNDSNDAEMVGIDTLSGIIKLLFGLDESDDFETVIENDNSEVESSGYDAENEVSELRSEMDGILDNRILTDADKSRLSYIVNKIKYIESEFKLKNK